MAVIKCKMCGGDLDISEGLSVCECEYCGTKQTVPAADNEKKLTLFARANRLRLANEFDKAAGVYESIVADFPEEAEAYWGLVLCRYGIEYVDDPATGKKVPTCHRVSFDSVLEDTDFDQACENADALARRQYREEAKQIEEIRRGIIEVSGKEEPYDIFICYKETDENGDRTVDSVIAQDVYGALTEKGYRVFFSRISLEDKLGTEYEPYIFAALNSAKLMLAFGTDYEYYNAVWVKNEWSRFLKLMEKDKTKHLIPCYKGIDAYDMPKEFHRLQGQDMGKVGAVQDLLRGIEKISPRKEAAPQPIVQQVVQTGGPNTAALLQRGTMALEDGDWEKAKEYFDQVLDMDAQCAEAYLGLVLATFRLHKLEEMGTIDELNVIKSLEQSKTFQKLLRFSPDEQKNKVSALLEESRTLSETNEQQKREKKISELADIRDWMITPTRSCLAAGANHTVGLRTDGTVVATGYNYTNECDVSGWRNIVAIAAGSNHTVGLRADGTVIATGKNNYGQCDVSDWNDIIAVAAGGYNTVGLRKDGTVVATGENNYGQCDVSDWNDIIAVAAGGYNTVGLRKDSTVMSAGVYRGRDKSTWRDIVDIAAGPFWTAGLKSDGTVVIECDDDDSFIESEVKGWTNVIAVTIQFTHIVAIKSDGTVDATGENDDGQCMVSNWSYIVAIAAGYGHTVALQGNGMVCAVGDNTFDQCEVNDWKLFNELATVEEERRNVAARLERAERERQEAAERAERERQEAEELAEKRAREAAELAEKQREDDKKRAEQFRQQRTSVLIEEKHKLSAELPNLKGIFSGKRRKEIEVRLAEIDSELKKLQ